MNKQHIRPNAIESIEKEENKSFMNMWFELKRQLTEIEDDDYHNIQLSIILRKMRDIEIMAFTNPVYKVKSKQDD